MYFVSFFFKCIYYMSITTGFLTTPTGSTSNQDLGSIFVAQNSTNSFTTNTYDNCTIYETGNLSFTQLTTTTSTGTLNVNVNFITAGNYLLCISPETTNSTNNQKITQYSIGLSNYPSSIVPFGNIAIATQQFNSGGSGAYNGFTISNTTILNVPTAGTYGVYYYNYGSDTWAINLTITAFFLTPYPLPTN